MRWMMHKMVVAVLLVCAAAMGQATTQPTADELAGNAALAERLSQMAQTTLAIRSIKPATLRQSAALLEAAVALKPDEQRFLRLLVEAYLQLGGEEGRQGAVSALSRYLTLNPADQSAQIQLIDLHFGAMQTADQQARYVEQILGTEKLASEVRAHAAVLGARLATERGEKERCQQYLNRALELFPLYPPALQMRYQRLDPDTPAAQRVALLLKMLQSNPAQPGAMMELAWELAQAGLVDPALTWYRSGFDLMRRMGMQPGTDHLTAYAAELVVADQLQSAASMLPKLLEQDPGNVDAAFLLLLVEKRGGNSEKIESATQKVRDTLRLRLTRLHDRLHGIESSTTQPMADLDLQADVKKLLQAQDADLTAAYAAALADLAWLEIYFNANPDAAAEKIDLLRQLLADDSLTLARLEGWTYLVRGQQEQAKVKLSAVADRDPLSGLGMIRIQTGQLPEERITVAAHRLLKENACGLVGAVLIEALRNRVGLMPTGPQASAIRAELDQFPKDWLDILDPRRTREFYSLKAEPLKVSHSYGEPMLARVTITNTSVHPITLGPEGTIRPDLWVDAQVKGVGQQSFPGTAFERLGQKLVLRPRESISQVFRVDQDGVASLINSNPTFGLPLYFSLLTNPVSQEAGIAPGPGGYRVQFTRVIERRSSPLNEQTVQELYSKLLSGAADVRIRSLEQLGTYASAMKQQQDNPSLQAKAAEIADVVRKSSGDSVSAVRAVATYVTAFLADASVREGIIRQMLGDGSFSQRVMGLVALQQHVETVKRKELAKPLAEGDADAIVRKLAASVVEVADLPPATQPSTQESAESAGEK